MPTDSQMERVISRLLRWGVIIASALVLAGGVLHLFASGGAAADYRVFSGEPDRLRSIPGIVREGIALHSRGLIQTGLLLLILTPAARVGFSLIAFILQRDRLYTVVTLIVFAVILCSLAGVVR